MNKFSTSIRSFLLIALLLGSFGLIHAQALLDPLTHPQFVNPLPSPTVATPAGPSHYYEIRMQQFTANLGLVDGSNNPLPTEMYGYDGMFPGPTIEARENSGVKVLWDNQLPTAPHILPFDETIHWANPPGYPATGVPLVTHLHGGHSQAEYDGYPDAWFTPGWASVGSHYQNSIFAYDNDQEPTTLWYHDHAVGITRMNVYAGLAGFYLLRNDWEDHLNLPSGNYEIPLILCDKSFFDDGSLFYPSLPAECFEPNPSLMPEFFGDFNLVNGKVWPIRRVEPRKYRFRILNGADSRFYNMSLDNGMSFIQIGSDGGLLDSPVIRDTILMGPAERVDVILDFTGMAPGTEIILTNDAASPFPFGAPPDPNTAGRIMKFRVGLLSSIDNSVVPANLRPTPLPTPDTLGLPVRQVSLSATFDKYGRLKPLLGTAQHGILTWNAPITENPQLNQPEVWQIINLTPDAHPIHLHQIMFQGIDIRPFDIDLFDLTGVISYTGPPEPAPKDWKDTFVVPPGYIGRIRVEFDIEGLYVWHCHILSHEDFDMMRPLYVGDCAAPVTPAPMEFLECGPISPATVGGFVWEDLNGNGIKDIGEPGIEHATVDIVTAPALNFVGTIFTNANGEYHFNNINPGSYFLIFSNPGGYYPTLDDQGTNDLLDSDAWYSGTTDLITFSSGEINMSIYAGFVPDIHQAPVLDPIPHPKFVNPLPTNIPVMQPTTPNNYDVDIVQFVGDMGIQGPNGNALNTTMYGYEGMYPGPTFEVQANQQINVTWNNTLPTGANGQHILPLDRSIHWANPAGYPASGVPIVSHLHGGHTQANSDGYPDAWYTPGATATGNFYTGSTYTYDNTQEPTSLWYHDHAVGITRLNVYAGLAGFYFIRDAWEASLNLPSGNYEVPMVLADRSFLEDGSLYFPSVPAECWIPNPSVIEEFFGDFNLVNGKTWPILEVEPRKYRFRVLNGADSRFYGMALSNGMSFTQIGTDGGFLDAPVIRDTLVLAPAERADIIIDFSSLAVGSEFTMTNSAPAPFPFGTPPDPGTAGQIMKFKVVPLTGTDNSTVPNMLRPANIVPIDTTLAPRRLLTLAPGIDQYGRLKPLLGTREHGSLGWAMPITENPQVNVPEVWEIINLTPDGHPIHLHQVMFQPLEIQRFDDALYDATGQLVYTDPPIQLDLEWKDTYVTPPGFVTRIAVNFDLVGLYVWHCHILSHEDFDMMRPLYVGDCNAPVAPAPLKFMECGPVVNATIGGCVWEDLDGDGIQDVGEPGIENDYVEIVSTLGQFVASTYSDPNGNYVFNNIVPGVYHIVIGNPGAYYVSPRDQGNDDTKDSDILFNGGTPPFAVASGDVNTTICGGFSTNAPTCNLTASYTTHCDVNGTPNDPSDDIYWIDLLVNGGGPDGWSTSNSGYTGNYGTPTRIGPYALSGGPVTLVVVDVSDPCCKLTVSIHPPAPCADLCNLAYDYSTRCYDNGTPNDPSDDYFYFKFEVTGGPSAGWNSTIGLSGTYNVGFVAGPYPISGGSLHFNVFDNVDPGCNIDVVVIAPKPCSSGCQLKYDYKVDCYNNGTPNDPSDDVFYFKLLVDGGPSSGWTSSTGLGGNYGVWVLGGAYPISGGPVTFTVSDLLYPGCNIEVTIVPPNPCSANCNLSYGYSTRCNNNGTPNDPSDDVFYVKLQLNGGPSSGWTSGIGLSGSYGVSIIAGPYPISGGPLIFTAWDNVYPGCNIEVTITPPSPCSKYCDLVVDQSIDCDDNGTVDPSDDVFYVKIKVTGGPSSSWVSNIGISGTYGVSAVYGPYSEALAPLYFTILDAVYPGCQTDVTVTLPDYCLAFNPNPPAEQSDLQQGIIKERGTVFTADQGEIILYPNPAQNAFNLELPSYEGKQVNIYLIDQLGKTIKLVEVDEVTADPIQINTDDIANGYYNVLVKADDGSFGSKKLIVMKTH